MNEILRLAGALRDASDADAAAQLALGQMVETVNASLEDEAAWHRGKLLRAVFHLRPERGYQGLYVLEPGASDVNAPREGGLLSPSLSAWRMVRETGRSVSLDVMLKAMTPRGGDTVVSPEAGEAMSAKSVRRLAERDVSHLYVLPVFAPGGPIGMVSIELSCRRGLGRILPWEGVADALELCAAVVGPYLAALPRRPGKVRRSDPLLPVVGQRMSGVVDVLTAFASEPETLLVRGETGVGKSRIAKWCHARSPRAEGRFEVLDLLAVPEEMQMGELFGWKRGAFTGAASDHVGYVGRAQGGTLFLDEIDKLSSKAQAALLTLLEERRYRVLGSSDTRSADVRFIVGTNADLPAAVREGRFREDLYYRINVLPIELPPLRQRKDEIAEWARFMLERRHADKGSPGQARLEDDAAEALTTHAWPGNLRQLDNIMRRAHALASATAADGSVRVTAEHVERAWGLDPAVRAAASGAMGAMRAGSAEMVARAKAAGATLREVDLPKALHGVLLGEAILQMGSREAAFELLGRSELVANRNHHKALKRDLGHTRALYAALDEEPPDDMESM